MPRSRVRVTDTATGASADRHVRRAVLPRQRRQQLLAYNRIPTSVAEANNADVALSMHLALEGDGGWGPLNENYGIFFPRTATPPPGERTRPRAACGASATRTSSTSRTAASASSPPAPPAAAARTARSRAGALRPQRRPALLRGGRPRRPRRDERRQRPRGRLGLRRRPLRRQHGPRTPARRCTRRSPTSPTPATRGTGAARHDRRHRRQRRRRSAELRHRQRRPRPTADRRRAAGALRPHRQHRCRSSSTASSSRRATSSPPATCPQRAELSYNDGSTATRAIAWDAASLAAVDTDHAGHLRGHRHDQAARVRDAVRRRARRPVGVPVRLERPDEVPDDRDRGPQPATRSTRRTARTCRSASPTASRTCPTRRCAPAATSRSTCCGAATRMPTAG